MHGQCGVVNHSSLRVFTQTQRITAWIIQDSEIIWWQLDRSRDSQSYKTCAAELLLPPSLVPNKNQLSKLMTIQFLVFQRLLPCDFICLVKMEVSSCVSVQRAVKLATTYISNPSDNNQVHLTRQIDVRHRIFINDKTVKILSWRIFVRYLKPILRMTMTLCDTSHANFVLKCTLNTRTWRNI